ncbi:MAG: recombinase family protein [Candidatus Limnocylindrales bacterium]
MNRLPTSLEAVRGLRAARWTRESTPGQYDAFGPDAQHEQQDRAIERWGLADTGLEWLVAHSGRTVGSTGQFADMVSRAGLEYDVLVVGYVSRFARNLRTAVNARHDLHAAGVAFLFADERLLSSDEEQWEAWAREAVEAEAYSRRLGKRIREGYGAKRRRFGVPGGNRPPLGTRRDGRELVVDPEGIAQVRKAYELAAAGLTDREVAQAVGLQVKHVPEILTNPFYAGRLWRGEPSALGPLVEIETWERVQALRARFSRRSPGRPSRHHPYALSSLLFCGACGRRLTGHVGRYRHVDACAAFTDARPRFTRAYSNASDRRTRGESYPAGVYEGVIPQFLEQVAVGARARADTIALATAPEHLAPGDPLALARITREREAATSRYLRERDVAALEATMARLDAEEKAALVRPRRSPTPAEAIGYLKDLPRLWRETDDEGRRAMAASLFDRINVLGTEWARGKLTPDAEAYGVAAAWLGPIRCSIGSYGRGERRQTSTTDLNVPVTWRLPIRLVA